MDDAFGLNLSAAYTPICLLAGKTVKMRQAGSEARVRTDAGAAGQLAQYLVRVQYPADPSLSAFLHEIAAGERSVKRGAQKHPECTESH